MKFTTYLQDTQTPEWENGYIDYHGLKAQLSVIRAKAPQQVDTLRSFGKGDIADTYHSTSNDEEKYDNFGDPYLNRGNAISAVRWRTSNQHMPSFSLTLAGLPPHLTGTAADILSQQMRAQPQKPHRLPPVDPLSRSPTSSPFCSTVPNLPASHVKFFDMLDAELDKVEAFYVEREEEIRERAKLLRRQLNELGKHRQLFHETHARSKSLSWTRRAYISVTSILLSMAQRFSGGNTRPEEPRQTRRNIISVPEPGQGHRNFVDLGPQGPGNRGPSGDYYGSRKGDGLGTEKYSTAASPKAVDGLTGLPQKRSNDHTNLSPGRAEDQLDPREYEYAKRRLRKAVVEHYRGLEFLNNYRIVNLAGFHKALRRYGKITKVPVLDAYMKEKVEPSVFSSGAMVSTMLKETEHLFAMRFEHGNKKKAISHLRVRRAASKTHHFSSFRTGLWLGLAFSAIAGGCYLSFQEQTRESLPLWDVLVFIYSIFLLPILLALLIGTNIFVWTRSKINYIFIFKLNSKSRLDYREYAELPSFILFTLAYAFLFSLARIGPPTLWPLIWLVLTLVVMLNPIRKFMRRRARWWTIKKIVKLGASGLWTVEFADLWLGDQFCSLVYSFANLFFVGCFYTGPFVSTYNSTIQSTELSSYTLLPVNSTALNQTTISDSVWTTCGVSQNWEWYYLLGVLPFLARFLQSLRRYWDSRLPSQLINAGKYGVGMIQSFCYFYWRHHLSLRTGKGYVLFCFMATVNSLYGCAWDYLVDWSLCKPYSRYPLLRPQLIYKSQILLYYLAMLSNICIRFNWLIYILFDQSHNIELFSFVTAATELLRRIQWNFYRLENKHLSNVDSYRATRELALPYRIDMQAHEEEERAAQLRLRKRMARLS